MRGYKCHLSIKIAAVYQLSVRFSAICQLSVKILAICQLSINHIQTLVQLGGGGGGKVDNNWGGSQGNPKLSSSSYIHRVSLFFFSFKACYDSKLFPGPFQRTGLLGTGLALSPFFESYHGVI